MCFYFSLELKKNKKFLNPQLIKPGLNLPDAYMKKSLGVIFINLKCSSVSVHRALYNPNIF